MLNKSKLKQGQQCIKALYLGVHQRYLAKYSKESQKAFSVGNEVGILARERFPDGILIQDFKNKDKIKSTGIALPKQRPIFEATFEANQVLAQVDILIPNDDASWDIIEVKSGSSLKDDYLEDIAIQYYVLKNANFNFKNVYVWYINKDATSKDDLFTAVEVTNLVQEHLKKYPKLITDFLDLLKKPDAPSVDIGSHCTSPYPCAFKDFCWKKIPSKKTIFQIPNFSQKWEAYGEKILYVDDPALIKYNINPNLLESIRKDKLWIDKDKVKEVLSQWTFPLSVLDFETFQKALPPFEKTRPYQQIPFQASVSYFNHDQEEIKTLDYLHETLTDPREAIADFLLKNIPSSGTILAYNKKFEIQVIEDLSKIFPNKASALKDLIPRIEDPWELLKSSLYHPKFGGSYSLKKVIPALIGDHKSYRHLAIKDGLEAQDNYWKLLKAPLEEKESLIHQMKAYCNADTTNLLLLYIFLKSSL